MSRDIDFFFDFISPYTYLASRALPALAQAHGATIRYRPVNLLELMALVGNRPTTLECANKGAYAMVDLERCAKRQGTPFAPNPHWQTIDFPQLGRGALVAIDEGREAAYIEAIFQALWVDAIDLGDRAQLMSTLRSAGLQGEALIARSDQPAFVSQYAQSTEAAAKAGAFGSPTFFLGQDMYFGADRVELLASALQSDRAA